ncbi:MAG: glycosyltransferase family 2 protein [Halorientalis sp.]
MSALTTVTAAVQLVGVVVGVVFTVQLVGGLLGALGYRPQRSDRKAENVRLVIPTVAAERVRDALEATIEHTSHNFPEYDLFCLVDEGSDLQAELEACDLVTTVVVPDDYTCAATAKGRAINYFVETVVGPEPDYWYGFLDDDNRILDESFLYEIPYYEQRGYRALNPVLEPRQGRSRLTYMADHIRYVDDIALYRLFTGVLGRPYLGFHGELTCVRGDVLAAIGFDRDTIVEDFGFALELVKRDVKVWQSATRVSVLSPHDLSSFFAQRARWYVGIARYLPRAPLPTRLLAGTRVLVWTVSITSSWLLLPLWLLGYGLSLPLWFVGILLAGTLLYVGAIAIGAVRIGGLTGLALLALVPLYASLEHLVPLYAAVTRDREFVVIEK